MGQFLHPTPINPLHIIQQHQLPLFLEGFKDHPPHIRVVELLFDIFLLKKADHPHQTLYSGPIDADCEDYGTHDISQTQISGTLLKIAI